MLYCLGNNNKQYTDLFDHPLWGKPAAMLWEYAGNWKERTMQQGPEEACEQPCACVSLESDPLTPIKPGGDHHSPQHLGHNSSLNQNHQANSLPKDRINAYCLKLLSFGLICETAIHDKYNIPKSLCSKSKPLHDPGSPPFLVFGPAFKNIGWGKSRLIVVSMWITPYSYLLMIVLLSIRTTIHLPLPHPVFCP